jgi:hypothetical protein
VPRQPRLFSGVADPQFTQHALSKGANDFWIKGTFDMSQLDDMVAKHVPTPA